MTGPEHYRGAETCLRAVAAMDTEEDPTQAALLLAEAQVHATLAAAAAARPSTASLTAWQEVLS